MPNRFPGTKSIITPTFRKKCRGFYVSGKTNQNNMKERFFAVLIGALCFVMGAAAVSCTEKAHAVESAEGVDFSRLKVAVYNYQRICDRYITDDCWDDVVVEGDEWDAIVRALGSPYSQTKSAFWAEYEK